LSHTLAPWSRPNDAPVDILVPEDWLTFEIITDYVGASREILSSTSLPFDPTDAGC
jgi:hypothetical protein